MMDRTDQQIKVDVVKQLEWNASVDANNINVTVVDGKARLSGEVSYYGIKKSAEDSAWLIPGVTEVINDISVKYPSTVKVPSDNEIKSNVENVLLWDTDVYSFEIDVKVDSGTVELSGTVDAYWKKMHAERIVDRVYGVIEVENKLAVVPTDKFSDKVIAENIVDAIDRLKIVDAETINVKVKNSIATVSGSAPSWIAKRAIENAAEFTAGVSDVKSFITIVY